MEGDYLIALYPGGGEVFDLSIPALPISIGTFIGTYPRHVAVDNRLVNGESETTLFVADYSNGLSLYTITDDGVLARGFLDLDVPTESCPEDNCATVALSIKVDDTYAYVVTDSGLSVVRLGFYPNHPKVNLATDLAGLYKGSKSL